MNNPSGVCFYEHNNYAGWKKCLGPGRYPSTATPGSRDNAISSIKVGDRLKVTIYEHPHFRGRSMVLKPGVSIDSLIESGWDNRISSIIVDTVQVGGGADDVSNLGWLFYILLFLILILLIFRWDIVTNFLRNPSMLYETIHYESRNLLD